MINRLIATLLLAFAIFSLAPAALASPGSDLTAVNLLVTRALTAAQKGDFVATKAEFDGFRKHWLDVEDGVRIQSKTGYRQIEEQMASVQFALLPAAPDQAKVVGALQALTAAMAKFSNGEYPADGNTVGSSGNLAQVLTLLDTAKERVQANDAAGAATAIKQFRNSWIDVEGVVLSQSSHIYSDAERDMVDAYAYLTSNPPKLDQALTVIDSMRTYLAPIAGKTAYTAFDAATIILREGLEALLIVVALLGFLKKAGASDKSHWIWGGVISGLLVSSVLAVVVKLIFGTGAFGNNNFLIAGWTGIFAAVMLIWVSYWLHSKSSLSEWNRYIREKSSIALATGNLISLATLSFLTVFREGTETVLFYVGMVSSIKMGDLLLGLGAGLSILALIAVAMFKIGLKVPLRPFFRISSLLVFYLGFKFTGMGIHGLQLAGVMPATIVPGLPSINFLALYPNWQSTLPQLALLLLAAVLILTNRRSNQVATPPKTV